MIGIRFFRTAAIAAMFSFLIVGCGNTDSSDSMETIDIKIEEDLDSDDRIPDEDEAKIDVEPDNTEVDQLESDKLIREDTTAEK